MKKDLHLFSGRSAASFIKHMLPALLLLSTFSAKAWQTMACNDNVQVSLDYYCEADITPDMILEGDTGPWDIFAVSISNVVGTIVNKPGFHTVTVTNTVTNNNCWGTISVEDKLPPLIDNCPCALGNQDPACQFYCTDLDGILNGTKAVPQPLVYENCGTYFTQKTDVVMDGACGEKIIKRTHLYTDNSGNKSTPCVSYFYLSPVTLSALQAPNPIVQLTCGADASPLGIFNFFKQTQSTAVANQNAYPTLDGFPIIPGTGICNVITTYSDVSALVCGDQCSNSKKILRSWIVLNWCTGESRNFIQTIKATDNQAPTIIAADILTTVDPWGCSANVEFPAPTTLHDNCSSTVNYTVVGAPLGVQIVFRESTQTWVALNVPKGIYTFTYKATDCCGNVGTDDVKVEVVDRTSPVAISKQYVVVSLTSGGPGQGIAKVYAASIDNGSHDGCTPVHLEIRRDSDVCGIQGNATYNDDGHSFDGSSNINSPNYDPDKGAYVKFCCADLTDVENGVPYGIVKVWLRVWDDGDMNGVFGSVGDNFNETWTYVRVEDKLPPRITCPPDVTIDCDDDYTDTSLTGVATGGYTCEGSEVEYSDSPALNGCGAGTVIRRWWVKGNPSVFCNQKITVRPGLLFNGNTIQYPGDITTDCKNLPDENKPTWTAPPCSLVGYAIESDTFKFEDGACFKIINTFTVVDWCVYDPNYNPYQGIWHGTQIIKVMDNTAPELTCTDKMFEVNDHTDADGDGNKCELRGLKLSNVAVDNGDCASKWLKWVITVDLWGDGIADYEYSSLLPPNDNTFNDSNLNGIPDKYISPTSSNQMVMIEIPVDIVGSMSNHKVHWKVTDGCGNVTSCTEGFMVVDKKDPTPYCINISTALMENGQIELWARDFDVNSFDNCTAQEDLLFTFNEEQPVLSKLGQVHYFKGIGQNATVAEYNEGNAQKWQPSNNSSAMIFNCDDLPEVDVKMSVWDEKLNTDYCVVKLTLVDNQGGCDPGARMHISGNISTEGNEPISNVRVALKNMTFTTEIDEMTSNEGSFDFNNVIQHFDYQIVPEKDNDWLNGVSTLDLVLIQRHVLNTKKLESAYKVIAADVNNDEKITASDLVELRKVILGLEPRFSNNKSWRFVSTRSQFANQNKPWPFIENIAVTNLSSDMVEDFIACKIGDVNESATANFASIGSDFRERSIEYFNVDNIALETGKEYFIPVTVNASLAGYQLSIDVQGLEVIDVKSSMLSQNNFKIDGNHINISWNEDNTPMPTNELFTLVVKANSPGLTSEKIFIDGRQMDAEAYTSDLEVKKPELRFINGSNVAELKYALLQNEPNPFKEKTKINFVLPAAADATLTIYDITGKTLYKHSSYYQKGINSIEVNTSSFGVSGLMYYMLESGDYYETKKMIDLK